MIFNNDRARVIGWAAPAPARCSHTPIIFDVVYEYMFQVHLYCIGILCYTILQVANEFRLRFVQCNISLAKAVLVL